MAAPDLKRNFAFPDISDQGSPVLLIFIPSDFSAILFPVAKFSHKDVGQDNL